MSSREDKRGGCLALRNVGSTDTQSSSNARPALAPRCLRPRAPHSITSARQLCPGLRARRPGGCAQESASLKWSERGPCAWPAGRPSTERFERGKRREERGEFRKGGGSFFLPHRVAGQLGWELSPCGSALALLSPSLCRSASLTLLPAEGAVRKRAGGRSSMSAPPPPRLEASTAAHLWLVWGCGAARGRRAPSLFHVNNKSSHPPPRLVCARRLRSSARGHSPGAARGAAARIAPRVANRFAPTSHLGSRRRHPEGREAPDFGVTALPRRGREADARPGGVPSALHRSALGDVGTRNVNSSDFKITPPAYGKGRAQRRREGKEYGEGAGRSSVAGKEPSPDPRGQAPREATHPERAVEAASPAPKGSP